MTVFNGKMCYETYKLSKLILKIKNVGPGWYGSVGRASSHAPKGCRFDSSSEHMSRLWVQSPVQMHMGSNQLMFSLSNQQNILKR